MRWLPIKNFENMYEVSDTGLVRSIDRVCLGKDGNIYPCKGKIKATAPNKNVQYMQVELYKNNVSYHRYVHRLVAEAFIPNPDNLPEVNHIDGNRQNNVVSNLEWVTRTGNVEHAIRTGLKKYSNRISEEEFLKVLDRVINGESYYTICQDPNIPYQVPFLSTKIKALAEKYNREEELKNALRQQKNQRAAVCGHKNRKMQRIGMYDKQLNLIKEFSSLEEAKDFLQIKSSGSISNALRGRQQKAGGYIWKYL